MRYFEIFKVLTVGFLAGFVAMWFLAFELAAVQGVFSVSWLLRAPLDPDFRRLAVATVLSPVLLSPVWYWVEGRKIVAPRRVTLGWYLKSVAWGLACVWVGVFVIPYTSNPFNLVSLIPGLFLGGVYGVAFGLPIVLVLSPIVVRVAER